MIRILIIEDEIPAFEKLRTHLNTYFSEKFSYDWARSVTETIHFLSQNNDYTLIFSDIELLDGVSFEAFTEVKISIPIIFCSAYDEYLFRAFQSNGIAYILKPYGVEEIKNAIEKYKILFDTPKTGVLETKALNDLKSAVYLKKEKYKERFVIKSKGGIHLLETKNIVLVTAEGDFCKLMDSEGKTHLYSQNIGAIYASLNPSTFFRINRSTLVQLKYITKIENHFKNRLLITVQGYQKTVMTSSGTTADFRVWLDR
ncbi:LytTR family DNA-binding domain-containing protein [Aquimarina sp. 2201CG5-10]|uniref:LytR/AlgR family response regulator transcription factor n=1 Tax=Aquimarina callyspongiae TaxID=3098150 RepID=UPI002AB38E91|nr:LytTR family DNA-binding domain-containing protein [Aquimarina sp. 2201CG5-10]MDY8135893.1 LytTR family DNA-binding domain-containing protein [Aquimarina sp. 2201CG5-10]